MAANIVGGQRALREADAGAERPESAPDMRLWMNEMRHLEPVMVDHERLSDAWDAGGVRGKVIGRMAFEDKPFTFDPNSEVYRRFGVEPPAGTVAGERLAHDAAI